MRHTTGKKTKLPVRHKEMHKTRKTTDMPVHMSCRSKDSPMIVVAAAVVAAVD